MQLSSVSLRMANESSSEPPYGQLVVFGVWVVQGLGVGSSNWVLAASILRYSALRSTKAYTVLLGLALADACNMTAYLLAGFWRGSFIVLGTSDQRVLASSCLTCPHTLVWAFAEPLASVMLAVASFDRLLFMVFPLKYITWSSTYAVCLVSFAFSAMFLFGLAGLVIIYFVDPQIPVSPFCTTMDTFNNPELGLLYPALYRGLPSWSAAASVLLLLCTWPVYMWRQKSNVASHQESEVRAQRAFTKSIGISTVCTLTLFIIPFHLGYLAWDLGYPTLSYLGWLTANFNPLANVFIYQMRHKESRKAVKALLKCQDMPQNLNLWKTAPSVKNVKSTKKTMLPQSPAALHPHAVDEV